MQKAKTCKECYDECLVDGMFEKKASINTQRIKSQMENAEVCISQADIISKAISQDAKEWMGVYTGYYEALRIYSEAFLLFEKTVIANHQCLFAYLCQNYPSLALSWSLLEEVRRKRNGVHYYGEHITYDEWKKVEENVKVHILTLKAELNKKLSFFEKK